MRTPSRVLLAGLAAVGLSGGPAVGQSVEPVGPAVQQSPEPQPRAALALAEEQRGRPVEALRQIVQAARERPDDPSVQRTAARLLAWFDSRVEQPALDDGLLASMAAMRKDLSRRDVYHAAYRQALADNVNAGPPPAAPPRAPEQPQAEAPVDTRYLQPQRSEPVIYAGPSWWHDGRRWDRPTIIVVERDRPKAARRDAPPARRERRR
jgi:hypothetical protein